MVFSFRGGSVGVFEARPNPFSWFAPWPSDRGREEVEGRSKLAARDLKEPSPKAIDLTEMG